MDCAPFVVSALINDTIYARQLIDSGCLSYGLCGPSFADKNHLKRIPIEQRDVSGVDGEVVNAVKEVAVLDVMDLDGYRETQVFLYITPVGGYDMILGLPWMQQNGVLLNAAKDEIQIGRTGTKVLNEERQKVRNRRCTSASMIAAASFNVWQKRAKRDNSVQIWAASIADINKALAKLDKKEGWEDPRRKLPLWAHKWADTLFN